MCLSASFLNVCTVDSITVRKLERSVYFERKNIKNFLLMKIWVHLLEREINLMGRPRTGAKDLLGTASQTENKQTCFHIENEEMIVTVNAIYATT